MPRPKQTYEPIEYEKATKAEIERRVTTLFKLMLKGYGRADMLQYVAESDAKNPETAWNISERQLENYIARANERFKEYSDAQRSGMLDKAVMRLEYVYMQCIKVQDYSKAIAALRELNLLLGLHEPQKRSVQMHITFEDKLLADITAGKVTYDDVVYVYDGDESLAAQLFARAGVPVNR